MKNYVMENEMKCEIANCDKPAQITINVEGDPTNCCRNHSTDVIDRAKKLGRGYKVEPTPPSP